MDGRKIVCNLKAFSSRDEPTERNHPALLHRLLLCAALLFWFIVTALISLISSHSRQLYQRESSDKPMYLPSIKQQATSWDKLAKRLIFPSSHSELAGPDLVWVPFIRWTNKYKCGCFLRAFLEAENVLFVRIMSIPHEVSLANSSKPQRGYRFSLCPCISMLIPSVTFSTKQ